MDESDIIIVGGGAAGATLAGRLAETTRLSITLLEAGPGDRHPLVQMPFGLVWLMGSGRDWRFRSTPQAALGGRQVTVPRGRMLGGSASINSMVWFRGLPDDYAAWGLGDWSPQGVAAEFNQIEARMRVSRDRETHALSRALGQVFPQGPVPDPARESAGVFACNLAAGRRWSPVDAFLRPNLGRVRVETGAVVDKVLVEGGRAVGARLIDGRTLHARCGIVLSAGAVASPAILMRSGLGPAGHLRDLGIAVLRDVPGIGANLHDHPAVGLFHEGPRSGRGLTLAQLPRWALDALRWPLTGRGAFASNTVEAGAFLRSDGQPGPPDVQVHFLPARIGHRGRAIGWGAGYYADVCVMQPASRGALTLASKDPRQAPVIDLGLLSNSIDLDKLIAGFRRLRSLLADAPFGPARAPEVWPGPDVQSDAALADYIRGHLGTAYHPVGTVGMGGADAALTPRLKVRGLDGLWVADASVMPRITSANTNAPSILIGHRAATFIADDINGGSP